MRQLTIKRTKSNGLLIDKAHLFYYDAYYLLLLISDIERYKEKNRYNVVGEIMPNGKRYFFPTSSLKFKVHDTSLNVIRAIDQLNHTSIVDKTYNVGMIIDPKYRVICDVIYSEHGIYFTVTNGMMRDILDHAIN